MTIAITAYDTFIGSSAITPKLVHAIEDAQYPGNILTTNAADYLSGDTPYVPADQTFISKMSHTPIGVSAGLVTHTDPKEAMIPSFAYPMFVISPLQDKGSDYRRACLVGDARPFMRAQKVTSSGCVVVNQMEFELLRVLIRCGMYWLERGPQNLLAISPILPAAYARWLGDTITRRFELDLTQRQIARLICAYFFLCCFTNEKELNGQHRAAMAAQACRAANVPINEFEHILRDLGVITSAADFTLVLKKCLQTPRLDEFNTGLLSMIVQGTWFGFNGRELAVAAIEHPPTFASMLYMAFAQNGYRKAGLAVTSDNFKGAKGGAEFVRNMQLQLGLRSSSQGSILS